VVRTLNRRLPTFERIRIHLEAVVPWNTSDGKFSSGEVGAFVLFKAAKAKTNSFR